MSSSSAPEHLPPEVLTIPEMLERYKDHWVGIEVTERDKSLQPVKGRVLAHDPDRYGLREKTSRYPEVCIFYAGEPPFPLLL